MVDVGSHALLPDTANQTFAVLVSGGDAVAGEDFYAQIGDGGTFNNGTNSKPVFQNVNIVAGTIFNGNNTGATGDPGGSPAGSNAAHPLVWVDGTTTTSGSVTASGVLATFTIDTTGVSSGTFPLLLSGVAGSLGGFSTDLRNPAGAMVPLTITNGSLVIVAPEPASLGLLAVGGLLVLRRRTSVAGSADRTA